MKLQLSSIRNKLQASFLAIILFAVFCSGLSYYFLKKTGAYQQAEQQIAALTFLLQEARKAEKDFMLYDRKQPEFLESGSVESTLHHEQLTDSIQQLLLKLESNEVIEEVDAVPMLKGIGYAIRTYEAAFKEFVDKTYRRGFRDHGLEVEMRNYVHELQEAPSAEEREYTLMMRRHEKDFIMRKDLKYVRQIHEKAALLSEMIEEGLMPHMNEGYQESSLGLLRNYINRFDKLVSLEKELGLTDSTGLRGELKAGAEEVEPQVVAVKRLINDAVDQLQFNALLAVVGFILLLLVVGSGIAFMLARIISRPLILLDGVIQDVLKGNYEAGRKLKDITNRDELGRLAQNFGLMLDRQHEHLQEISKKNRQLEAAAAEDTKRQWAVEGLNKFTDLMKQKAGLKETCSLILSELVKYTHSNQGGLFLLAEGMGGDVEMQLAACYAYDRRKYIHKQVLPGEGLVGASWLEKDTIYITDVPQNYINITSGLGGAKPGSILIVPLISEDKVEGVIELASFKEYEPHQIRFVEEFALRFASVIEGLNMQEKTVRLLEETKLMAEEKQAQEEEMRQQMEEQQASQEEMYRKVTEAESMNLSHRKDIRLLESVLRSKKEPFVITDEKYRICYQSVGADHILKSSSLMGSRLDEILHMSYLQGNGRSGLPEQKHYFILKNNDMPVKATMRKVQVEEQVNYAFFFKEADLKEKVFA
jgi:GAF domain-containing protein/HAMP domain-containing protein